MWTQQLFLLVWSFHYRLSREKCILNELFFLLPKISIYAVPEKWHQTHYALEAALRLLEFYEQYFNILYPLPKMGEYILPFLPMFQCISYMMCLWIFTLLFILWCVPDLIAIPDFQSGAMENWGLTTYRETSLLYDPDISSASDKLWVTLVIGHELAHQVIYKIHSHSHLVLAKPMNYRSIVLLNVSK